MRDMNQVLWYIIAKKYGHYAQLSLTHTCLLPCHPQLEDSVQQLTRELKTLKLNQQKYKMELDKAQQQITALTQQRTEQEQKVRLKVTGGIFWMKFSK